MTHITIDSDKGLSPGRRRQAITWIHIYLSTTGPLGTTLSEIQKYKRKGI